MPGASDLAADLVAARIQRALEEHAPASVGTASHPVHGGDVVALEAHADAALYAGKARRRAVEPSAPAARA